MSKHVSTNHKAHQQGRLGCRVLPARPQRTASGHSPTTVYLPSCQDLKLRHMYKAMDLLHANIEEVEKTVFFNTANLFNLEVDLIFYDTTTASFHVDYEDDDTEPDSNTTLRKFGHANCKLTGRKRKS